MSCPRWSDRGTTGWIRKSSASSVSLCWTSNRLQQQGWTNRLLVFAHVDFFCSSFFDFFFCQPVLSALRSYIRTDWEQTLFHFWFPAQTPPPPPLFTTTEQQLYLNNNMSDPEKHKFNQTKVWNGREAGEEEQMSQNGTGWSFSVPKNKKAIEMLLRCQKVVPFYTLMYAHKHSLTHTQTQSHAPSIVIRGQNMVVMFSTIASLRMSFICFHGGEHRIKRFFFLKKTINKKKTHIKKWIAQKKKNRIFSKKRKSSQPRKPREPLISPV